MRILITGGAGYIGTAMIKELNHNPDVEQIIVFDNLSRKNYNLFFNQNLSSKKIQFIKGELLDSRLLRKVVKTVDAVIHLAAKVTTPFASEDAHLFEQVNHWGTAELVYAVEDSNVKKFIYLSSSSVYGASENYTGYFQIPNPVTVYGISKLRGEEHVARLLQKLSVYILRCGNVYGFSPAVRFDAIINKFMFDANFNQRIFISGNGQQYRAFIHIGKVVSVLNHLLIKQFDSGIYDLVEYNFSVNEIVEVMHKLYPDLETLFVNQHLQLRELKVQPDERLMPVIQKNKLSFEEELLNFKQHFSF